MHKGSHRSVRFSEVGDDDDKAEEKVAVAASAQREVDDIDHEDKVETVIDAAIGREAKEHDTEAKESELGVHGGAVPDEGTPLLFGRAQSAPASTTFRKTAKRVASRFMTVYQQASIVKKLDRPVRLLGIVIAFCAVIWIWEAADVVVLYACPKPRQQVVGYVSIFIVSSVLLVLSHIFMLRANQTTLHVSFVYALSTLLLAIGAWGVVKSMVRVHVPPWSAMAFWLCGSAIFLVCTVAYTYMTRHNALLDIASCALSLGLFDEEPGYDSPLPSPHLSSRWAADESDARLTETIESG